MKKIYDLSYEESKEVSKKDREDLKPYEIEVDQMYKTGKPRRLSPKNCYLKAFEYMRDKNNIKELKLVHGLYKPKSINNHCGHAWVEFPNGVVFDGVLQRFYDKESYYNHYQIIKHNEYNRKEMFKVGLKNGGNYGPWI